MFEKGQDWKIAALRTALCVRLLYAEVKKMNIKFLERANELAKEAFLNEEVPVGAVVVKDGNIIGEGRNEQHISNNFYCHAEFNAIKAAMQKNKLHKLENCIIYVTLEPCLFCFGLIMEAKIKRIVYAIASPKFGFTNYVDFSKIKKIEIEKYKTDKITDEMLKKFFKNKR